MNTSVPLIDAVVGSGTLRCYELRQVQGGRVNLQGLTVEDIMITHNDVSSDVTVLQWLEDNTLPQSGTSNQYLCVHQRHHPCG